MDTPGYLVKQALAAKGWEQRTLAVVCGWSESKVSRLLTDQETMTAAQALVLAEVLPDLSPEQLLSAQGKLELARTRLCHRPKLVTTPRTDSDRYAELRKLVEEWKDHVTGPTGPPVYHDTDWALIEWSHR